jgi:hypothetical protein
MADLTFRDFAGALMQGDRPGATTMLEQLLGLATPDATKATDYFGDRLKDPTFMVKAMGLRTAVTSGSDADISNILGECFGLDEAQRPAAVAAVRKRYPPAG